MKYWTKGCKGKMIIMDKKKNPPQTYVCPECGRVEYI